MSWITDDGVHEGWVARILDDGRESVGGTARRRDDGSLEFLELVWNDGDPKQEEKVPSDRVRRWVPQCTCGWRGTIWERVTEPGQASDAARRGWRPLGDIGDAPEHVEETAHAEWRRHLAPQQAVAAITAAAAAVAEHQRQLTAAVHEARRCGVSWERIGAAAGISRQSAHERWGASSRASSRAALDDTTEGAE